MGNLNENEKLNENDPSPRDFCIWMPGSQLMEMFGKD